MTKPTVAIAGAGIGGLSLAIDLGRRGFKVTLFERATKFEPVGAGIVLAPNATFVFKELGIVDELCDRGQLLSSIKICTPKGRTLSRSPGTLTFGSFEFPLLALHRSDLQDVLLGAALRFPETRLFMGAPLLGFEQDDDQVVLMGPEGRERFDLLVGADGVHSLVREVLHGPHKPRYAGQLCYRGIAQGDFSLRGEASETWGAGKRFGIVPLGEDRVYWFAVIDRAPHTHLPEEQVLPFLKQQFVSFHAPVGALLDASSTAIGRDLADAVPLSNWSHNRVTLLGDAAHPMTPNVGQGAGQSIEDAACLARILDQAGDRPAAISALLVAYEKERIPRTSSFVEESRKVGRLAQLKNPMLLALRNLALLALPQGFTRRAQHKRLFGASSAPLAPSLESPGASRALLRAEIPHGQSL